MGKRIRKPQLSGIDSLPRVVVSFRRAELASDRPARFVVVVERDLGPLGIKLPGRFSRALTVAISDALEHRANLRVHDILVHVELRVDEHIVQAQLFLLETSIRFQANPCLQSRARAGEK